MDRYFRFHQTSGTTGRPLRWLDDDATYLEHIRACQEAIREGEAYQLCLTTRVEVPGVHPDPVDLLTAPRTAYARQLVASVPRLPR